MLFDSIYIRFFKLQTHLSWQEADQRLQEAGKEDRRGKRVGFQRGQEHLGDDG